ncbi:unnamed protein product [Dovyalis caffra]|uniref:EF-hand domain-containing protein n=1 Tax=Dovyalis caffra TaxID=77055 RepID=A0AAV1RTS7_9ROSI|nr:unnamed protein product [Dovyalis caffra]
MLQPQDKNTASGPTAIKAHLKEFFKKCDINHDNRLSRKELKKAFDELGALFPSYRAGRGLSNADANKDGQIDMDRRSLGQSAQSLRKGKGNSLAMGRPSIGERSGLVIVSFGRARFDVRIGTSRRAAAMGCDKRIMGFRGMMSKSADGETLSKEHLKKFFMKYDINRDNRLGREELKQAFGKLGAYFPCYRAARSINHADANNDGQIDMDELSDLVNYAYKLGYTVS